MVSVVLLTQLMEWKMATSSLLAAAQQRQPTLLDTSLHSQDARKDAQQQSDATLSTKRHCPYRIDSLDGHDAQGMEMGWHSGGWAVRQLCSQPLDTLFFVHTAPRSWQNRAHLRATLFEEAATKFFNWTVVFFVGETDDLAVRHWTALEAKVMGDMVMLPYNDTLLTVLHKFIGGMRWVIEYCPNVRSIVKIDDDVGVHPFELRRYLEKELPRNKSYMHCFVWLRNKVYRESFHRFCIREDDLAQDNYPLFCSGRSVIMTVDTMRKLFRASKIVRAFATDDAYVTGQLALFANVGHIFINARMDWSTSDKTEAMLEGKVIFTHEFFEYGNSIDRRAQWGLMLWKHMMQTTGRHPLNLSYRLEDKLYRLDFHRTRRALQDSFLYLQAPE
ncbi:hypothetical protein HPB49_017070 [Dermacentor silvarum]|uniref:Uncharacterized protein n=1 Tax=Dermacentor silvarum TaxID=543639 RepID=A0ACB8DK33_DERSI|nr:N-acetyllactosaminide beta-1,3-N-acetylglucosaminyltransferase 3 [Dermacentor silvarum]KAH7970947.1 hypothetical protein HPB49_017070 [Dermacentor silvarum]